jgi:hypothetical protein
VNCAGVREDWTAVKRIILRQLIRVNSDIRGSHSGTRLPIYGIWCRPFWLNRYHLQGKTEGSVGRTIHYGSHQIEISAGYSDTFSGSSLPSQKRDKEREIILKIKKRKWYKSKQLQRKEKWLREDSTHNRPMYGSISPHAVDGLWNTNQTATAKSQEQKDREICTVIRS